MIKKWAIGKIISWIISLVMAVLPAGVILVLSLLLLLASTLTQSAEASVVTKADLRRYQELGEDLQIDWDVILMLDVAIAVEAGEESLENSMPMKTALNLCSLMIRKYQEVEGERILVEEEMISGYDNICSYLEVEELLEKDSNSFLKDCQKQLERQLKELEEDPQYEMEIVLEYNLNVPEACAFLGILESTYEAVWSKHEMQMMEEIEEVIEM